MTLNLTVNEGNCSPPPSTVGVFNVRAHYTEADAGHLYGTFGTRQEAEHCLLVLAARSDVVYATIEEVV